MKTNYLFRHLAGTFFFYAILFVSAGRLDYRPGLIYVTIGVVMLVVSYTILRIDKELLAERSKPGANTKQWDRIILGLSLLVVISMYVVAGLDSGRYHWSGRFHWGYLLTGILLTVSGQLLFLIAQKQNNFFSSTARIQTDRGHAVCDVGLYQIVRHPAYLGSIVQSVGFPFLFGSRWSAIPVCLSIGLFVTRTILEDKMLKDELKGYLVYCEKTRFRLIPFVW